MVGTNDDDENIDSADDDGGNQLNMTTLYCNILQPMVQGVHGGPGRPGGDWTWTRGKKKWKNWYHKKSKINIWFSC